MASAEDHRRRRTAQARIRRRCTCGRIITGNPAWWSHTTRSGRYVDGHPDHRYAGRA